MKRYVLGFAFAGLDVVLIQKARPSWQAGRWNGIGGHIEEGEEPVAAMVREFQEETGVATLASVWRPAGIMGSSGVWSCLVFTMIHAKVREAQTCTDEGVALWTPLQVREHAEALIDNVPSLLALCRLRLREDEAPAFVLDYTPDAPIAEFL